MSHDTPPEPGQSPAMSSYVDPTFTRSGELVFAADLPLQPRELPLATRHLASNHPNLYGPNRTKSEYVRPTKGFNFRALRPKFSVRSPCPSTCRAKVERRRASSHRRPNVRGSM